MTVIVISCGELDYVKCCLAVLQEQRHVAEQIIVVDSTETDEMMVYLGQQNNVRVMRVAENANTRAKIVNQLIEEVSDEEDWLLMDSKYLPTPGALEKMQRILCEQETIGIVGARIGGGAFPHGLATQTGSYEELVALALEHIEENAYTRCLGVHEGAYLIRKGLLGELGGYEECLKSRRKATEDFSLRAILQDYSIVRAENVYFYDVNALHECDMFAGCIDEDVQYMYKKWGMHYFNQMYSPNLIKMIDATKEDTFSVLEIGCDCGATLLEIQNRFPNATTYGVELNENAVQIAEKISNVIVGNIEEQTLGYENDSFDYILFGDVLEHLREPEAALNYVKRFLKKDGKIIASIPNLMHISVMEKLLNGFFTYTETGLLDKTHIHMFTYYEILRMFNNVNTEIEAITYNQVKVTEQQKSYIEKLVEMSEGAERFMYEAFQYILRARKL